MTDTTESEEQNGRYVPWRQIATYLIALICGSVLSWMVWLTVSLGSINERQTEILTRMRAVETSMSAGTDDRYRGRDAQRDFAIVQRQIDDLKAWTDRHDHRLPQVNSSR